MTRRTALQFVAALITAWQGERMMADEQTAGPTLWRMADSKPSSIRFHLDPDIRLEVSIGGEIIEIPQDELIAALQPDPPQETP